MAINRQFWQPWLAPNVSLSILVLTGITIVLLKGILSQIINSSRRRR